MKKDVVILESKNRKEMERKIYRYVNSGYKVFGFQVTYVPKEGLYCTACLVEENEKNDS